MKPNKVHKSFFYVKEDVVNFTHCGIKGERLTDKIWMVGNENLATCKNCQRVMRKKGLIS